MNILLNKKRFISGLLLSFNLFFGLQALRIGQIKETYEFMADEFKPLSPLFGAVWWETKMLSRYYQHGYQQDATINLIKNFFHEVNGSVGITASKAQPAYHMSPRTIGMILALIEQSKNNIDLKDNLESELLTRIRADHDFCASLSIAEGIYNAVDSEIKKTKAQLSQTYNKHTQENRNALETHINNLFNDTADKPNNLGKIGTLKKIAKNGSAALRTAYGKFFNDDQNTTDTFKQMLGGLINNRAELEEIEFEHNGKKYTEQQLHNELAALGKQRLQYDYKHARSKRLEELVRNLFGALNESNFYGNNDEPNYISSMVQSILLTFVYCKAKDKISDDNSTNLLGFFEGLSITLGVNVLTTTLSSDEYPVSIVMETIDELNNFVTTPETTFPRKIFSLSSVIETIGLEKLTFIEIMQKYYMGTMPKIADYKQDALYQNHKFPDCIETTIRNFCNILMYQWTTQTFSTDLLTQNMFIQAEETFRDFYSEQYPQNLQSTMVEDRNIHNQWAELISNRPHIVYGKVLDKDTNTIKESRLLYGFIKGIDPTQYTDLQNIVVAGFEETLPAFTHEGLTYIIINDERYKLFDIKATLYNFILLIQQLFGLELYAAIDEAWTTIDFNTKYFKELCEKLNITWTEQEQNLDNKFTDFLLNLSFDNHSFTLNILSETNEYFGHGDLTVAQEEPGTYNYQKHLREHERWKRSTLNDLSLIHLSFFYLNAHNFIPADKKAKTHATRLQHLSIACTEYNYDRLNCLKDLVRYLDTAYQVSAQAAQQGFQSQDFRIRTASLELFKALLQKKQGFDQAIQAAQQGMQSKNTMKNALELFEILIQKFLGFDEAIQAAEIGFQSEDNTIRLKAMMLLQSLVIKKQGYEVAIKIAQQGFRSENPEDIRIESMVLFQWLVIKEQGYPEVLEAAEQGMSTENTMTNALILFIVLVKKEQGYTQALEAAEQGMSTENTMTNALILFGILIKKEQGYTQALQAAQYGIQSDNYEIIHESLKLFQSLVKKGHGYTEAREAANNHIQSKNIFVGVESRKLLENLNSNPEPGVKRRADTPLQKKVLKKKKFQ